MNNLERELQKAYLKQLLVETDNMDDEELESQGIDGKKELLYADEKLLVFRVETDFGTFIDTVNRNNGRFQAIEIY